MPGDDDALRWLTTGEAAKALGCSRQSVQQRIKRGTLDTRSGNRGQRLVGVPSLAQALAVPRTTSSLSQALAPELIEPEPPQPATSATETVPLSLHLAEVERLQAARETIAAHSATVAALQSQVEQLRSVSASHDAETARRLAERDALYLDTLGRMQAQAAIERSLWLERIDAAELRAERVEQRLDQVLDQLLERQRQSATSPVEQGQPWWRRLFGTSTRSKLGTD
jgi:hypothetical protein